MRHRFDPDVHHRRSIRLKGHDYARGAAVFVTVCTYARETILGDVMDGSVRLSRFGEIVLDCWSAIPDHFPGVSEDAMVVMPNHVHGILFIDDPSTVGPGDVPRRVPPGVDRPVGPAKHSVGAIVGSFKSAAARQVNSIRGAPGAPVWQRNYYEHIIRDENELWRVHEYIAANPAHWIDDDLYTPRRLS